MGGQIGLVILKISDFIFHIYCLHEVKEKNA
jgi:hypothetical protein